MVSFELEFLILLKKLIFKCLYFICVFSFGSVHFMLFYIYWGLCFLLIYMPFFVLLFYLLTDVFCANLFHVLFAFLILPMMWFDVDIFPMSIKKMSFSLPFLYRTLLSLKYAKYLSIFSSKCCGLIIFHIIWLWFLNYCQMIVCVMWGEYLNQKSGCFP